MFMPARNGGKIPQLKKEEGTLASYTNDVHVDIDYRRVDPRLLEEAEAKKHQEGVRILEDTLAQQCLSKPLYPGTILKVSRVTKYDIWEICGLMVKQLQKRLEEKELTLEVDVSVRNL